MTWTTAKIEQAKTMWGAGDAYRDIAVAIGVSKNAVSGMIFRLGLSNKIKPKKPVLANMVRDQRADRQRANRDRGLTQTINRDFPGIPLPKLKHPPAEFLAIPFLDLTPNQCRYPRGEVAPYFFCGQRRRGESSYCATCHAVAYGKLKATEQQINAAAKARAARHGTFAFGRRAVMA
jgi:hypothetical protein